MTEALRDDLARALAARIKGEVRTDLAHRTLYATDASIYRIVPTGVVIPRDEDDVRATVAFAAETGTPILPRGAGTSLAGQAVGAALVVDMSRHLRGATIDAGERTARVRPGTVVADLNAAAAPHGLQFGPDPASANRCTVGGLIANNGTGVHSILYRMAADHVRSLRVLLADGSEHVLGAGVDGRFHALRRMVRAKGDLIRARYPRTWRRVTGYNLPPLLEGDSLAPLFCGAEGTLGVILEAEVGLVERPEATALAVCRFGSLVEAMEAVGPILETNPSAVELLDGHLLGLTRGVPEYAARLPALGLASAGPVPPAVLIVEYFVAGEAEGAAALGRLEDRLRRAGHRGGIERRPRPADQAAVWAVRKEGLGLLMSRRGDSKPLPFIEDCAVPVERLPEYVRGLEAIFKGLGVEAAFYAHASAGCLHVRPLVNPKTRDGRARMGAISDAVADLVLAVGGAMAGEHGDGLAKGKYMEKAFGKEIVDLFRSIKHLLDPKGLMNPGKIHEAVEFLKDLRYEERTIEVETFLDWSRDGGLGRAVEMCNGEATCRKRDGLMCPSYQATQEEEHATRGRANLLLAALRGDLGPGDWARPEVGEALDLCLACKGCLRECPAQVDMAKMKAEYLHRVRVTRGLPLADRLWGRVDLLLGWAARAPGLAHAGRGVAGRILGLARGRSLPAVSPVRFTARPEARADGQPDVLLFADTFVEHIDPAPGLAALRLLRSAGFRPAVVRPGCCGRPAFSKGLLPEARARARRVVEALGDGGAPVVVLEPSCLSMFVQDYLDLLPGDGRAAALARRAVSLEAVVLRERGRFRFAPSKARLVVHPHCHQRAMGLGDATLEALRAAGARAAPTDAGCCGMAGSFGYEARHAAVSRAIFDDRLGPAVRASPDAVIVAPGVSCREQVRFMTGRPARHPAEVLADMLAG